MFRWENSWKQLKNSAQNLDIQQKQKIVRLLVREVVLSPGTATIHHSIPLPQHRDGQKIPTYRLCPRGHTVTSQCLQGDSVVSKRDKGSPCHASKRDKKCNPG